MQRERQLLERFQQHRRLVDSKHHVLLFDHHFRVEQQRNPKSLRCRAFQSSNNPALDGVVLAILEVSRMMKEITIENE
jgi:hypothetical protein